MSDIEEKRRRWRATNGLGLARELERSAHYKGDDEGTWLAAAALLAAEAEAPAGGRLGVAMLGVGPMPGRVFETKEQAEAFASSDPHRMWMVELRPATPAPPPVDASERPFAEGPSLLERVTVARQYGVTTGETGAPDAPKRPHLVDGEFQSDKYPTTPRGKVPLSTKDPTAQDLLWEYAQRRRSVDAEFADDLETALRAKGFVPARELPIDPASSFGDPPAESAADAPKRVSYEVVFTNGSVAIFESEVNKDEFIASLSVAQVARVIEHPRDATLSEQLADARVELAELKKQSEEDRRRYREENQHAQNDTTKAEAINDRHVKELVEARAEVERAKDELEKTHLESSALLDAATAAMVDAANIHVMLSEELDAAIQERDRALRFEVTEEQRDQAAEMLAKKAIGARDPRFVDVTTCRADVDRVLATLKATR